MITLQKFERLISAPLAQKEVAFTRIGQGNEAFDAWATLLSVKSKHEQYAELKTTLSEILVANIPDGDRLALMDKLFVLVGRTVEQMHADYIYENQSLSSEQQASVHEVRSLYFLMILVYRNVALRHQEIARHTSDGKKWLGKLIPTKKSGKLSTDKDILTYSIHQMMALYVKLLLEYALLYQKVSAIIWQEINAWYLKALSVGIKDVQMADFAHSYPKTSIYDQYMQACAASFGNFFAYRRQDILNAFKVLPSWTKYFKTTFEARPEFRVFVNLQGSQPPEVITPYASINPYSNDYRCLFFDLGDFVAYMEQVSSGEHTDGTAQSLFEARFAKMVLLAFEQRATQERQGGGHERQSELLVGFSSIFHEMSGGQNLSSVIRERSLPAEFRVQMNPSLIGTTYNKEMVGVTYKNDMVVQFHFDEEESDEELSTGPKLHVYGLFAIKSSQSVSKNPWRLGVVHWAEKSDKIVQIDGRFLGRVLMAVGIRLRKQDGRSQEFVHALLVDGDGLSEQSTLVMPRYHFKSGDYVVLRIDDKEMELRLERNVLTTDEIEQYQIVRLSS